MIAGALALAAACQLAVAPNEVKDYPSDLCWVVRDRARMHSDGDRAVRLPLGQTLYILETDPDELVVRTVDFMHLGSRGRVARPDVGSCFETMERFDAGVIKGEIRDHRIYLALAEATMVADRILHSPNSFNVVLSHLKAAQRLRPEDDRVLWLGTIGFRGRSLLEDNPDRFDLLVRRFPDNGIAWFVRMCERFDRHDYVGAAADARKTLELLRADDVDYLEEKRFLEATERVLKEALEATPDNDPAQDRRQLEAAAH